MIPPAVLAAAVYTAGIALGALLGGPWWQTALLAGMLALAAALHAPDRRGWGVLLAAVALAAGGHARYHAVTDVPPPPIAAVEGVRVVTGVAREDARLRGSLQQIDLDVEAVDDRPTHGGLRLRLRAADEPVRAGERIRFNGRVESLPQEPPTPGTFDYAAHLRGQDIHALALYPLHWERLGQTDAGWRSALRAVHRHAVDAIARTFPEPEAALAAGVLVGEQGTLPPRDVEALRVTGTTHLVVVSGHNVHLANI